MNEQYQGEFKCDSDEDEESGLLGFDSQNTNNNSSQSNPLENNITKNIELASASPVIKGETGQSST